MSYQVDFEPIGRRATGQDGSTLLESAQRAGVMLTAVCGGGGVCGRCRIQVMSGPVSAPTEIEESLLPPGDLHTGWRLACQARAAGDVRIYVPPDSLVTSQRTQTEGQTTAVDLAPAVLAFPVSLTPPDQHDLRSDAARVRDALFSPDLTFDGQVLRSLSAVLRAQDWSAAVFVRRGQVVQVGPAGASPLGLAVDIGTTKLAAYLLDLGTGRTLASAGAMNPQLAFGEDVMARISHAMTHSDGADQLRLAVTCGVNDLARDLCSQVGSGTADIADAVVAGNTAMHHLFLGLQVRQLGLAPYVATDTDALDILARDAGLDLAPGACVHLLPNIAGFVGADHVAMLLATRLAERRGVVLAMDIGTNTEVSLVAHGRHLSCSTASGPAFEGAHIRCGMRAAPGAIEEVAIRGDRILFKTIGDLPPVGLCGSGILDVVAQMLRAGIINRQGAMAAHPRVRPSGHGPEFVVVPGEENGGMDVTFSRADVSAVQLAKAAMRAGVNILLRQAGVTESDIDEVIVAGAFGSYLDVQSGIDIGMFPRVERRRFRQVGNAAGAGARMALLSTAERERARELARQVTYVELTAEQSFSSEFAAALFLE